MPITPILIALPFDIYDIDNTLICTAISYIGGYYNEYSGMSIVNLGRITNVCEHARRGVEGGNALP